MEDGPIILAVITVDEEDMVYLSIRNHLEEDMFTIPMTVSQVEDLSEKLKKAAYSVKNKPPIVLN